MTKQISIPECSNQQETQKRLRNSYKSWAIRTKWRITPAHKSSCIQTLFIRARTHWSIFTTWKVEETYFLSVFNSRSSLHFYRKVFSKLAYYRSHIRRLGNKSFCYVQKYLGNHYNDYQTIQNKCLSKANTTM